MKLVSTPKTFTKIILGIFFLFVAFKSSSYTSLWKPAKSYLPTEINSLNAPVACSIFVRAAYINDSVHIRYFISRPAGAPLYQLGSSNLVLTLDPAYFDLANAKIVRRSAWDEKYNPNAYRPLSLGFNNVSQILSLNIEQKTIVPIGLTPPINDSLLAEVTVPVIQCVSKYAIKWSRSTPQGEILDFLGNSIYNETILTDAPAIDACPCNAAFTGLGTTYCTSSFLSKLIPKITGGVFVGTGVKFGDGIWYFNPFDAGPGEHTIKHILPCGDTISKKITVEAAPCQSISGQDGTLGYIPVATPQGIFTDCLGQIYTTSFIDQAVYKIDTFGIKALIAGTVSVSGYQDGSSALAKFAEPAGITVSSSTGLIYVADSRNQVIRQINPFTNQVTTLAGSFASNYGTANDDGATGITSKFSQKIIGITFDKTQTNLYVTESSSGLGTINKYIFRVRKVDITTGAVTTIAGGAYPSVVGTDTDNANGLSAVFRSLVHISADDNFLYVADPIAKKIKKIGIASPNGVSTVTGPAGLLKPVSASVSTNGVIYAADQNDYTIKEILQYPAVSITNAAGISGDNNDSPNTFVIPNATSVFVKGFIDVADFGSGKIKRIGIKDYGSLPFKGSSKNYCYNGVTDTLNYIIGSYTGAGISKINNVWVFNPIVAGIGKHVIKYSFDLNSCNSTFADTFIVHPKPKPFKGLDKVICSNELGKYKLDAGPGKNYSWFKELPAQLIAGQNSRFLTINNTGTYSVVIKDTLGCFGGDTISISTIPSSSISLGADINLCAGFKAALAFSPTVGFQSVLWQDSTTNLVDTAYGGGVYHVTVKDANGCFASDTLNVISSLPPTPLISSDPAEKCVAFVKTKALFPKENTFLTPQLQGMVIDKLGNTYITDYENNLIRKIDKFGIRTIYAGTGTNQLGTSLSTVKLSGPYGITIDRNQNIFITEVLANIVRKITPNGVVSIYAGVYGMTGFNGEANKDSVLLWQPTGIDADDIGNIYITEYERHIVRKISPVGYTQIIGDINSSGDATGSYNQTRFNRPQALAIDKAGFIYVADLNKNIKKIDPFAKKVTVYTTLPVTVSTNVKGLAIDNLRRMYFTMNTNYTVYYVDPRDSSTVYYAGVSNVSGSTDGLMTTAKFQDLQGLYINENGGALYAVDKNTVRIITDSCGVTICEGYVATLTANKHTSYEWNNNAAQAGQSIQVGTAGKYFVKVGNSIGCTFYDTIQVSVIPKPIIKVTKDTVVCVGDSSVISANVSPITANDTIIWRRNGKLIKQTIGVATNTVKVGAGVYNAEVRTGKLCVYYATSKVDSIRPILDAYASKESDTVCQGQAVQLKVDVQPGSYKPALTFLWTGEIVNGDTVQNPTANPLSANKNKYVVKVTDANGCFNIDTAFIFVKPRPIISTLKDTNVCRGSTITLFTNVSGGKLPYKSQYWTPSIGLSDPSSLNPSVTPTDSIVYEISVTDADNCTSKDEIKIGVIKFDVSPATTDADTLCPNSKAQLNVTASKGSGKYKYQWSPASGLSSAIIKNPIAQPATTTEYSVVVTDNVFYCQQTRSVKINTVNLSVNTGNDVKTCIGSAALELQANTTGGTKPYTYIWTPAAGLSNASIFNPKIATNKIGAVSYIVTVNDAGGCTDKDTILVSITDKPVIKASNDTLLCADVRFNINALLTNASFPVDITWTNNKDQQILNGNTVNIAPTDSIKYYVSAVDANGCISNLDSVFLAVIKLKASVTALPTSICPNTSSQLKTSVAGGLGKLTYTWLPATNLDNASIASPKATLNTTTKYIVTVKDSIGCNATDSVRVVVSDLKINAGIDKKICLGTTYQLGAAIAGGTLPYSKVTWTPAIGLNVTNVLNPTFTSSTIGKYEFVVTAEDAINCTNSDTILIEITPAPIADAGKDLALCFGTSTPIGGNPTANGGAGAPYQYIWTTTNSPTGLSDANAANPIITASSDAIYIVTVTDASQCKGTDTIAILVNKLPVVNISKNKETACAPESVILSIIAPSNGIDYNWKVLPNNNVVSSISTFEAFANGDFRAIAIDKLTQCKDSAVVNVAFINPPTNLFINAISALCINAPIVLEGSALGDELVYSWKTSNGKGKFTNSATSTAVYNPNELLDPVAPSAIAITLVVSNACKSDSISKSVFLSPSAKPSFKIDAKETLPGDPMAFYNITDTLNKGPLTYQWFFGDGNKSTTFNAAHIYPDAGEYMVMLIAKNTFNCLDTATLLVDIIGTQILYIPNAFSPSADNFENKTSKVYGTSLANDGFEWNIYNRWGEIIYNTTIAEEAKSKGWNGNFKNDGDALPAGVFTYTLKAKLTDGRLIDKTGTISLIR